MDAVKDFMKEQGIYPSISFKDTPKVVVKIIAEPKQVVFKDTEGNDKLSLKFLVEENGVKKTITSGAISFITQIAEYEVGDTLIIEMKRKSVNGQPRTFFQIQKTDEAIKDSIVDDTEDIGFGSGKTPSEEADSPPTD